MCPYFFGTKWHSYPNLSGIFTQLILKGILYPHLSGGKLHSRLDVSSVVTQPCSLRAWYSLCVRILLVPVIFSVLVTTKPISLLSLHHFLEQLGLGSTLFPFISDPPWFLRSHFPLCICIDYQLKYQLFK